MPASPYAVTLTAADRGALESLARRGCAPHRLVLRAQIVLLAADGLANCVIAGAVSGAWRLASSKIATRA